MTDELKGELARLPDGRAGVVREVNRFESIEGNGTAVVEPLGDDAPEVVAGIPKVRAWVRAADHNDVDDPREAAA